MVETVKQDEEVSLGYMKIFEREEMLVKQGRAEERANTERERRRADAAEKELARLRREIEELKKKKRITPVLPHLRIWRMRQPVLTDHSIQLPGCSFE